jgi:hypothetical protein
MNVEYQFEQGWFLQLIVRSCGFLKIGYVVQIVSFLRESKLKEVVDGCYFSLPDINFCTNLGAYPRKEYLSLKDVFVSGRTCIFGVVGLVLDDCYLESMIL